MNQKAEDKEFEEYWKENYYVKGDYQIGKTAVKNIFLDGLRRGVDAAFDSDFLSELLQAE